MLASILTGCQNAHFTTFNLTCPEQTFFDYPSPFCLTFYIPSPSPSNVASLPLLSLPTLAWPPQYQVGKMIMIEQLL